MKAIDEAWAFAEACEEYSTGAVDAFHRRAFHKAAEVINMLCEKLSTNGVINRNIVKENEKGKEKVPPHPPKENKGKDKEMLHTLPRAREEVFPPKDDVLYAAADNIGASHLFADYWRERWERMDWINPKTNRSIRRYWRDTLLTWWTCRHDDEVWRDWQERHKEKDPVKSYAPADWALCRERCAHCDERGCTVGCKVPPDRDPRHPQCPEECPRYSSIRRKATAR